MSDFRSKIRKATDTIQVKSIFVLLFGDPGMGKTSLSFTATNPLHLDYDRGIQRSVGRKDSLEITSWQDGIDLLQSNYIEEMGVKSLIFDTAGTMLDNFAALFIINESAKNGKPGGGLSLQGYGALKEKFKVLKNLAESKGIDLIFLCHVKEEKDGDVFKKIANVTGGSYDILKGAADLIGYMEIANGKRTLDFNPTDRHDGKNCPEFPLLVLPHYTDPSWSNYLGDVVAKTKEHMNRVSQEQQEAIEQIQKFTATLNEAPTSDVLSALIPELEKLPLAHKVQLKKIFDQQFMELWASEFISPATSKEDLSHLIKTINELGDKKYHVPLKIKLLAQADKNGFWIQKGESEFKLKVAPKATEKAEATTEPVKEETKAEAVK